MSRTSQTPRRRIDLDGLVPLTRGYPTAIVSNGLVFISGLRGARTDSPSSFARLPESFRQNGFSGFTIADQWESEFATDAWTAHENLDRVLKIAGSESLQVLRLHIWLKDKRLFPVYERIRMAWQSVPAPSSCLGVTAPAGRFGRWTGIEALAVVPGESRLFPQRATLSAFDDPSFPSAAFYSQAVRCGPLLTMAGHIPIATNQPGHPVITGYADIPEEGRFLEVRRSHTDARQGRIAAQAWFTYDRIRSTLRSVGLGMAAIKHVAVMLQDVRDFNTFHRVHRHFFPDEGPAMIVTGCDEVGHKGTLIEIEPTAVFDTPDLPVSPLAWPMAPPFAGPAAVRLGPLTFLAGILGLNLKGQLVRNASDVEDDVGARITADLARFESAPGFAAQSWAAWHIIQRVFKASDAALSDLAKITVYLRDARDLWIFEEIREAFLPAGALPAAEFVAIKEPGPLHGAQVQIEAIASTDK
jgi:enamine deaminase RidA (YjgF/YER057c/UK114 family)